MKGVQTGNFAPDRAEDTFERADESAEHFDTSNQLYFTVPGQVVVAKWLETFKEFPPRQKPASFNIDEVMRKLQEGSKRN